MNFDFLEYNENNKYGLWKFIHLLVIYLIIFIGLGGSSLLSQRMFIEVFKKIEEYFQKRDEMIKFREKIWSNRMNSESESSSSEDEEDDYEEDDDEEESGEISDDQSDDKNEEKSDEEKSDHKNEEKSDEEKSDDKNEEKRVGKIKK